MPIDVINLWPALLLLLVVLMMIAGALRYSVRKMISAPEPREEPAAQAEIKASVPVDFQTLLDSEGFRFTKAYAFHENMFGIWIRISPDPPLRIFYLSKHTLSRGIVCEFITAFSDDDSLATTITRAAFLFPRLFGSFTQSFPTAKSDELWRLHLQGEDYLTSELGILIEECRLPFLESFKRGVVRDLSHVTSLRFWSIRGIYWYSVKRFLLHNRPIWNQEISKLYHKTAG